MRGEDMCTYEAQKCIQGWWGDLRERDHLEKVGVNGRIILKCNLNLWDGGMDWIDLDQDTDRWRAVVNAVTNLLVPQNSGNFLTS
jgi:hypothetical protein